MLVDALELHGVHRPLRECVIDCEVADLDVGVWENRHGAGVARMRRALRAIAPGPCSARWRAGGVR